ncbi:ribonuclease P protein component [Castellaniella sp.]|uniref:ribonuclease P protein component n=1 Tax=Castellaniella sp. TaxID=1955812 RepID=UPI00355CC38C
MAADFPPSARLHRPSEYAAALRGRRVARGALFVVHQGRETALQPQPQARLGLIIPKRLARLAVVRNAIKRVVREAWRQQRHSLPATDLVFRLVARPPQGSLRVIKRAVRQEADALLARVIRC